MLWSEELPSDRLMMKRRHLSDLNDELDHL
ncbi:hypothetical protein J5U23_02543 [Saccharolobus shibatae B12]|jgi:hypothetical protein|uniref:Uncharacterized protein n=2 Tax=Saccharolobus shibatae TaxID=2286 RepID=A0A8F5BWY7_9CREN|nr:hypothetical protein J5U23_02543 [Saccharolobus shibatae B12]QXJ32900.1 hypothetical protein J5U21_02555 [Saccharolobus shibatae]QXJ36031.1 hypothetical protein J5U22_02582 [Saccharolobus shibatae]